MLHLALIYAFTLLPRRFLAKYLGAENNLEGRGERRKAVFGDWVLLGGRKRKIELLHNLIYKVISISLFHFMIYNQ